MNEKELTERIVGLEAQLAKYQKVAPRIQGVVKSFRMQVIAATTAIMGILAEAGLSISDDHQRWIYVGVAAAGLLLIYSDTHRKIGA